MKICTLVVRILGFALLTKSVVAIVEMRNIGAALSAQFGSSVSVSSMVPGGAVTRLYVYAVLGIAVGLACAIFAPFLARVLTFDEPER